MLCLGIKHSTRQSLMHCVSTVSWVELRYFLEAISAPIRPSFRFRPRLTRYNPLPNKILPPCHMCPCLRRQLLLSLLRCWRCRCTRKTNLLGILTTSAQVLLPLLLVIVNTKALLRIIHVFMFLHRLKRGGVRLHRFST